MPRPVRVRPAHAFVLGAARAGARSCAPRCAPLWQGALRHTNEDIDPDLVEAERQLTSGVCGDGDDPEWLIWEVLVGSSKSASQTAPVGPSRFPLTQTESRSGHGLGLHPTHFWQVRSTQCGGLTKHVVPAQSTAGDGTLQQTHRRRRHMQNSARQAPK
eukprot:gene7715-biopygen16576